eukprot:Opistho-2@63508
MAPGSHTVAAYNTQRQHSTTEAQEASPATLPLAPGHLQADVPIRPGHVHRVPGSHLVFLVRQGDHVDYPAVNLFVRKCASVHCMSFRCVRRLQKPPLSSIQYHRLDVLSCPTSIFRNGIHRARDRLTDTHLITDTPCAIVHVVATNDDIQHLGRPRELDTVPAFRLLRCCDASQQEHGEYIITVGPASV